MSQNYHQQCGTVCRFSLPPGIEISNLKGLEKGKGKGDSSSHIVRIFQDEVDASLTWDFVTWMREVTDLPVFVKVGSCVQLCCLHVCTCAGSSTVDTVCCRAKSLLIPQDAIVFLFVA